MSTHEQWLAQHQEVVLCPPARRIVNDTECTNGLFVRGNERYAQVGHHAEVSNREVVTNQGMLPCITDHERAILRDDMLAERV